MAAAATGTARQCTESILRQFDLGADSVILHGATPVELEPILAVLSCRASGGVAPQAGESRMVRRMTAVVGSAARTEPGVARRGPRTEVRSAIGRANRDRTDFLNVSPDNRCRWVRCRRWWPNLRRVLRTRRLRVATAHRNEVGFYRQLAPTVNVRVPECRYAAISDDGASFTLLLEDVSPRKPGRQADGCSFAEATEAVENLGRLHASRLE